MKIKFKIRFDFSSLKVATYICQGEFQVAKQFFTMTIKICNFLEVFGGYVDISAKITLLGLILHSGFGPKLDQFPDDV